MFHHDSQQRPSQCIQVREYVCYANKSFSRQLGVVKVMIHKDIGIATKQRGLIWSESWEIEITDVSIVQKLIFIFFVKRSSWLGRQHVQLHPARAISRSNSESTQSIRAEHVHEKLQALTSSQNSRTFRRLTVKRSCCNE